MPYRFLCRAIAVAVLSVALIAPANVRTVRRYRSR
jgi:hypothetical protein